MIIRRKHTANFTTISNALFNDERLSAAELGIMAFLRSRPHDWEVRRPALGRRFKIGRDDMRTIMRNLISHGWIVANMTRLADGKAYVIYEVQDEPGPELSADAVRAALSFVSNGAGPDQSVDDDGDGEETGADPPGTAEPDTGEPHAGEPHTAKPPPPIETLLKTEFTKIDSTKARARVFDDVKAAWPPENILSEAASQAEFLGLSDADKEACFLGERPYLADCYRQNRKICDLRTFIKERRWERFAKPEAKAGLVVVKVGTPQFYRWKEYRQAIGDWTPAKEEFWKHNGGMAVASEWPPALPDHLAKTG